VRQRGLWRIFFANHAEPSEGKGLLMFERMGLKASIPPPPIFESPLDC
jgi:hypothetical protein